MARKRFLEKVHSWNTIPSINTTNVPQCILVNFYCVLTMQQTSRNVSRRKGRVGFKKSRPVARTILCWCNVNVLFLTLLSFWQYLTYVSSTPLISPDWPNLTLFAECLRCRGIYTLGLNLYRKTMWKILDNT